jgi:hypothetical protein
MRPSREEGLFVLVAPVPVLRRKRPPAGEAGTRRPAIAGQADEESSWGTQQLLIRFGTNLEPKKHRSVVSQATPQDRSG